MVEYRRRFAFAWLFRSSFRNSFFIALLIGFLRLTKGAGFMDSYAFLVRPFWPGTAQKEWLIEAQNLEQKIKINSLENDNYRLREILSLQRIASEDKISAAVISRKTNGWWQQLELNKGRNDSIEIGYSVVGPGGLVGIINSVTPSTSRVKLLTSPGSSVGVWVERIKSHAILIGMGTNRTKLSFLDKDVEVKLGDIVTTSPASSLVPPNLPVGVVQFIQNESSSVPFAIIQLTAAPEAIDWVQILKSQ